MWQILIRCKKYSNEFKVSHRMQQGGSSALHVHVPCGFFEVVAQFIPVWSQTDDFECNDDELITLMEVLKCWLPFCPASLAERLIKGFLLPGPSTFAVLTSARCSLCSGLFKINMHVAFTLSSTFLTTGKAHEWLFSRWFFRIWLRFKKTFIRDKNRLDYLSGQASLHHLTMQCTVYHSTKCSRHSIWLCVGFPESSAIFGHSITHRYSPVNFLRIHSSHDSIGMVLFLCMTIDNLLHFDPWHKGITGRRPPFKPHWQSYWGKACRKEHKEHKSVLKLKYLDTTASSFSDVFRGATYTFNFIFMQGTLQARLWRGAEVISFYVASSDPQEMEVNTLLASTAVVTVEKHWTGIQNTYIHVNLWLCLVVMYRFVTICVLLI